MDGAVQIGHPKLGELLAYWIACRGVRGMPARADIDPAVLRLLLPNLLVVAVEPAAALRTPRLRYRLVGVALSQLLGQDITGRCIDEMPFWFRKFAQAPYREVLDGAKPHYGHVSLIENFRPIRYHRLLLPLSDDDSRVDAILGAVYPA